MLRWNRSCPDSETCSSAERLSSIRGRPPRPFETTRYKAFLEVKGKHGDCCTTGTGSLSDLTGQFNLKLRPRKKVKERLPIARPGIRTPRLKVNKEGLTDATQCCQRAGASWRQPFAKCHLKRGTTRLHVNKRLFRIEFVYLMPDSEFMQRLVIRSFPATYEIDRATSMLSLCRFASFLPEASFAFDMSGQASRRRGEHSGRSQFLVFSFCVLSFQLPARGVGALVYGQHIREPRRCRTRRPNKQARLRY